MENEQIIKWNINESKIRIKDCIKADHLIIFFTRISEDLKSHGSPNFYGRIKEIFLLIYPYSKIYKTKEIFEEMMVADLISKEGLKLSPAEINYIKIFLSRLDRNCKLKDQKFAAEIDETLKKLTDKYTPNTSKKLESYLIGKLISSVGGIKNLSRMPSSTIQLIGAEKALFRHIARGNPSAKHGLIYYSKWVRSAKEKGKAARKLANGIAISIKQDYFQNFVR